jgi:hypothetical protein
MFPAMFPGAPSFVFSSSASRLSCASLSALGLFWPVLHFDTDGLPIPRNSATPASLYPFRFSRFRSETISRVARLSPQMVLAAVLPMAR